MEIIGVDPGVVHTGVVLIRILPHAKQVEIRHEAVAGTATKEVALWIIRNSIEPKAPVFIEAFRPRSNFGHDQQMVAAVSEMHKAVPGSTVLQNTGVKRVVTQQLMELLGVWKFSTPTHHQDLRSAARIALLGAMKDEEMNLILANVTRDGIDGQPWTVTHLS